MTFTRDRFKSVPIYVSLYLAKAPFSQNFKQIKIFDVVERLFNPSDIFSFDTNCPLRHRWRNRVPQSFIHTMVVVIIIVIIIIIVTTSCGRRFAP